jgi:hypothetical protein
MLMGSPPTRPPPHARPQRPAAVEAAVLAHARGHLLTPDAAELFAAEFAAEHARLTTADPAPIRARLADAERRLGNLIAAIEAGLLTPTTQAALQRAEADQAAAAADLRAIARRAAANLPDAAAIYAAMLPHLDRLADPYTARAALAEICPPLTVHAGQAPTATPIWRGRNAYIESDGSGGMLRPFSIYFGRSEILLRPSEKGKKGKDRCIPMK